MTPVPASGFTLFELLLVIAIAAGLALVVAPTLGLGGATLASATRALAAAFHEARNVAIAENRDVEVTVDAASGTVRFAGRARTILRPRDTIVATDGRPLRFLADGSANGAVVALARGQDRRAVEVEALTGRIRVAP